MTDPVNRSVSCESGSPTNALVIEKTIGLGAARAVEREY